MGAIHCPRCVADGVDCPLIVDGECTHCGYRAAPFSCRLSNMAFQIRFTWDSITWRLQTIRYTFDTQSIGWLLACVWIVVFISRRSNRL